MSIGLVERKRIRTKTEYHLQYCIPHSVRHRSPLLTNDASKSIQNDPRAEQACEGKVVNLMIDDEGLHDHTGGGRDEEKHFDPKRNHVLEAIALYHLDCLP